MSRVERSLFVVVIGLALLAIATYVGEGPGEMNDLEVFYRAGQRFVRGESLYRAADGHMELKYLPVSAALFAPLTLVSLGTAKVVWLVGCVVSLALAFVLAARLFADRLPPWGPIAAFIVLARSIEREYANGQINALLLLLVVASFVLLEKRSDIAAGALLGIAGLLKPPWLVLLPYLFLARRGRAATTLLSVVAVGLALPSLRYGIGATLDLHHDMNVRLAASTARLLTYPTNVSLPGAIAKVTGGGLFAAALAATLVLAVPCLVLAQRVWFGRSRPANDLAVLAPLAILLSPQAWDYTVLTTLPALLLAASAAQTARWPLRIVTMAVASLVALDYIVLLGRGPSYEALMRWSPNTWFLLWMLGASARIDRSPQTKEPART